MALVTRIVVSPVCDVEWGEDAGLDAVRDDALRLTTSRPVAYSQHLTPVDTTTSSWHVHCTLYTNNRTPAQSALLAVHILYTIMYLYYVAQFIFCTAAKMSIEEDKQVELCEMRSRH